MTVSSLVPVNNYTGNSSTKLFDFDFLIESENELVVQYQDKNGIISVLKYGIDYSINEIGNKNGSYIEFPLNGSVFGVLQPDEQISLSLSLQIKQESEFHNSSYLNLDILEWTFDYIVRILQILNRKIDRCVKVEESVSISPDEIINELNDKYEKVNSAYSQIVEISKNVEENKKISIEQTNKSIEYSVEAKEQAELAKQKAKEAGMIIGEKVTMFSSEYVPECCLPCDGATYSRSQFEDFCENYLGGNTSLLNVCTLAEYESEIATTGQCLKFGADRVNKTGFEEFATSATININYEQFRMLYPNGIVLKFEYNGSDWVLDGKIVDLIDYALSSTGTPTKNDYFTVGYWLGYVNTFRVPLINSAEENKYFVVVANGQTKQSLMNWSAWASSLQGRLDTDVNNITNIGKANITDLLSPDYSAGVEKVWGETYTAEVSGWVWYCTRYATKGSTNLESNICLYIDDVPMGVSAGQQSSATTQNSGLFKVGKGSTYRTQNPSAGGTSGGITIVKFFPDKGVTNA